MQRTLPPATCLVTVLQFTPEVSLLALTLIVPPVLGGSTLVGGGGAGPLGLLFWILSGSQEGAIVHEELVVGRCPELREPDGCDANNEGGEGSSQIPSQVEEVLEVSQGSSLSIENLEVPQVVVISRVDIAVFLGGVADHAPELLKPADS